MLGLKLIHFSKRVLWCHQPFTSTNVDFSSLRSSATLPRMVSQEYYIPNFRALSPRASDLRGPQYLYHQMYWWCDSFYHFVTAHNLWDTSPDKCKFGIHIRLLIQLPIGPVFWLHIAHKCDMQFNNLYPCIKCLSTWYRPQSNMNT